ncbi:hypothetical protein JAAARDRAFT_211752 [Jaapia argillacea MUCL 33604]|uniref:Uncharacterized protein n=1 Tax=Jaapia argillacea MUCL 33604 TaxID=933084 RepID=A0A067PHI4_9AGAM|nr:hypothetical protein JAAARDRAFT_211752 [Jaapia argillacea MUCL 33604]
MNFQGETTHTLQDICAAFKEIQELQQNLSQAYGKLFRAFMQWGLKEDPELWPLLSLLSSWSTYITQMDPNVDDKFQQHIINIRRRECNIIELQSCMIRTASNIGNTCSLGVNQVYAQCREVNSLLGTMRNTNTKLHAQGRELRAAQEDFVQFWVDICAKREYKPAKQTPSTSATVRERSLQKPISRSKRRVLNSPPPAREAPVPPTRQRTTPEGYAKMNRRGSVQPQVGTARLHNHILDDLRDRVDEASSAKFEDSPIGPTLPTPPSHANPVPTPYDPPPTPNQDRSRLVRTIDNEKTVNSDRRDAPNDSDSPKESTKPSILGLTRQDKAGGSRMSHGSQTSDQSDRSDVTRISYGIAGRWEQGGSVNAVYGDIRGEWELGRRTP